MISSCISVKINCINFYKINIYRHNDENAYNNIIYEYFRCMRFSTIIRGRLLTAYGLPKIVLAVAHIV